MFGERTGQANGQAGAPELSQEEQAEVAKLKQREQEVRRHEQAHLAAAGAYARGGANFTYTTGPDGRRYASGGEVSIDVGAESSPEATLRKMAAVKRAAVAPAEPSPQDRAIYAAAARTEIEARQKMAEAEQQGGGESASTPDDRVQAPQPEAVPSAETMGPAESAIAYQAAMKAFKELGT